MSAIGDSQLWREALIDVYELVRYAILRAWPDCQAKIHSYVPPPKPKRRSKRSRKSAPLEDPITRDLIIRLRRDDTIRSHLIINSQRELLPDSPEEGDPDPLGYLDIAVEFFIRNDQLCLAIECKRLNVARETGPPETLARKYVEEGMMRFVSGRYSAELPLGGMIGYVMDGDPGAAHAAIHREIERAAVMLRCESPYIVVLHHPVYFSTDHARPLVPIQLRHLLLPAN
jgi:hypothetical protein